ncbi:MAG: hypothetical protein OEZ48_06840 [Candidatus Bathyarchaeota archaeon]|nr:hypothetical protein [Candidatus Bathyarchaeota archaeon]
MSSEKFKKFLESQAEKTPVSIGERKISWEERDERKVSAQPSDFLESVYFGEEIRDTVVMERSAASMLKHQLASLEDENEHLRKSLKILKIASIVVVVVAIAIIYNLWLLLNLLQ